MGQFLCTFEARSRTCGLLGDMHKHYPTHSTHRQVLSGMARGNGTMKPEGDSYGEGEAEVGARWDLLTLVGNIDRTILARDQLGQMFMSCSRAHPTVALFIISEPWYLDIYTIVDVDACLPGRQGACGIRFGVMFLDWDMRPLLRAHRLSGDRKYLSIEFGRRWSR